MKPPRNLFRCRAKARNPGEIRYLPKVAELARRNRHMLPPGSIRHVFIMHDPDCPRQRGEPCRCEPEVSFAPDPLAN
jgi:hypothetical protein